MSKLKHDRRRLGLETLEGRLMLDGNVTVQVVWGNLSIVGDRLDNAVEVHPAEIEGSYVIAGLPTGAATDGTATRPTLINGSQEPLTVRGVTGDVRVDLRAGNDSILFGYPPGLDVLERPLSVPNNLSINDSGGADQITLRSLAVGKDLRITTLGGNDWISTLGGMVGGNDRIEIVGGKVGGNARIVTGAGDDTVALTGLRVAGDLGVSTSLGNDRVTLVNVDVTGDATITTSLGNDEVAIQAQIGGDLVVNAGFQVFRVQPTTTDAAIVALADADSVSATQTTVGGNVKFSTASGDDKVAVDC